jgi:hypothetical protein
MQMMKTTASTGPTTQMSPSSPSTMGWGSGLSSWKGSEKGLAANVCGNREGLCQCQVKFFSDTNVPLPWSTSP